MRRLSSVLIALCLAAGSSGCVRRVVHVPPEVEGQKTEDPPPGMIEVNVVSEVDEETWDVYAGGTFLCQTPCMQWVDARSNLVLAAPSGERLSLRSFGGEAMDARRALVVAEGTHEGKRINGIVFTTFGGMGVVTAIALTAIGCSDLDRRAGVCTAGLITGAVSLPVTAFALWMLLDSPPKLDVLPVYKAKGAKGSPLSLLVAPNGVAGTF